VDETAQAIFLSYTSQDADTVRRLCEALRNAGLTVWFDQSELRGGDAWDASIRRQIRDCGLFMPVISANTEARPEGYFRLEWRLAIERFNLMADDHAFLMPVVIDDTNEATARVPDRFRERQWTRLPSGEPTPAFIDQVKRTLAAVSAGSPASTAARAPARSQLAAPARAHRPWMIGAVAMAAALLAALVVGFVESRQRAGAPAATALARAPALAAPAASPASIAVLPFANLTGKAEDAYLADGLQEEILSTLARFSDLKVISRTSTAEFRGFTLNIRDIGTRLGVGSVLEGSVRRNGNKMRLTVQLIDTSNDRHVLAADYDRDVGNILGLQTEVARKVADALSVTLSKYERGELDHVSTNSGDAYELYLRAVAAAFKSSAAADPDFDKARRLLEEALHRDPEFLDAAALLSQTCTWQNWFTGIEEQASCARKYYERALEIDPLSPEARLARGLYEIYVAKDPDQAVADLDAVVRVRPNSALAHRSLGAALRRRGRFEEALRQCIRAWDLDPLDENLGTPHLIQSTLLGLRRYPEFFEQMRLFKVRLPSRTYTAYVTTARIEAQAQHSPEPLRRALTEHGAVLDKIIRMSVEAELARAEGRYLDAAKILMACSDEWCEHELRLGFLYWAAGKTAESQRWLRATERLYQKTLKDDPNAFGVWAGLGVVQSMLGEHAAALASADKARALAPEAQDHVNGPHLSFWRSIILVRAGRKAEGYAEVNRLLRVPFGAPIDQFDGGTGDMLLIVKNDPHYDRIVHDPPRL
jgi:TolB-like protein